MDCFAIHCRAMEDPFSGHLFVFRARRGDLLKIILLSGM
jgi:transposase